MRSLATTNMGCRPTPAQGQSDGQRARKTAAAGSAKRSFRAKIVTRTDSCLWFLNSYPQAPRFLAAKVRVPSAGMEALRTHEAEKAWTGQPVAACWFPSKARVSLQ